MRVTVLRLSGVVYTYIQKKNQINANSHLYTSNLKISVMYNSRSHPGSLQVSIATQVAATGAATLKSISSFSIYFSLDAVLPHFFPIAPFFSRREIVDFMSIRRWQQLTGKDVREVELFYITRVSYHQLIAKINPSMIMKKAGLANRNIVLKFILNSRYIPLPV